MSPAAEVIRNALEVFGGMMACLPFFFYFLRIIMKNSINDERNVLRDLFIDRKEYEAKHTALQDVIYQSLRLSEKNNTILQNLFTALAVDRATAQQEDK